VLLEKGVKVLGFIDASSQSSSTELTVHSPSEASIEVPVVIGVCNLYGDLQEIYKNLSKLGFNEIYSPVELFYILSLMGYEREHYWLTTDFALFEREMNQIQEFRNLLEDEQSKSLFDSVLKYRKTGDVWVLPEILPIEEQYLPRDLPVVPQPMNLIDCGAYVGEIIEYARNLDFEVNSIFAFEPDPSNYLKLTQNLNTSGLAGTSLAIPMGVGDATALLRFSADGNLSAAISDVGDTFVQITSIDECIVSRDINYVKMDIEGAEQKALIGMKNMLINLRPNPAISAYHKPNDLWSLGLWLNKLNLGYKFSIRCYGHQCFDTVLYGYQVDKEHK
jgi:FkbM family methyltransferase